MDCEIIRRSFLKRMLTLSAFAAGSSFSLGTENGFDFGMAKPANAEEKVPKAGRVKKIAVEEHYYTDAFLKDFKTLEVVLKPLLM